MSNESAANSLYCPICGYNLTGLGRNVCPECQTRFDPAWLAAEQKAQMIGTRQVILHLLWPPAVVFLASCIPMISLVLMPLAMLFVLIFGIFHARRLARRVALTRAVQSRDGTGDPKNREFFVALVVGFMLFQWILAALLALAGCAIAWSFFH